MNVSVPVPPIVYLHPIKELPSIPDSVSTYSFDHAMSLQAASLLNPAPSRNRTHDRAEFVPARSSTSEFVALSANARGEGKDRFQVPTYRKPAAPTVHLPETEATEPPQRNFDDHLFKFYMGSISIVGLLILFRLIQKSE